MNTKVATAIERLNKILPLAERQQKLDKETAEVYQNILHSYVERGASLSRTEIAQQVDNIDECIGVLKQNDMVVFDSNDEPIGAYPFTMEQREHEVTVNGNNVHCMCAPDALAVSPMFDIETMIKSRCHVTAEPVSIRQRNHEIIDADSNSDVYFGISWNSAANNCCATSLCTEMIFLKGERIADQWQAEDADNREIFHLHDAIEFAAGFFVPLMTKQAA
jgi:mercuric reductase